MRAEILNNSVVPEQFVAAAYLTVMCQKGIQMKWSFDKWCIEFCGKNHNQMATLVGAVIYLALLVLFVFFIKAGYQFGTKSTEGLIESITIGIFAVIAFTIFFFVYERDPINLVLPFAFAISGILIGISGGFFNNFLGWFCGIAVGLPVAVIASLYCFRKAT